MEKEDGRDNFRCPRGTGENKMTLDEAKKRLMTEEGFRKAYEELEEEYAKIKASIESEASTEGERTT